MQQIIDILLENFDISYMLSINILTYIIIKFIDYINGKAKVKLITKRLVLIICTIVCCVLYSLLTDINVQKLINSTIAAPVFYSWVMKPILTKYKIGYKNGTEIK